jgi:uncharacterized membrane protein YfcA
VPKKIAAALSLLVFAMCLLCGVAAHNSFSEILVRALEAMFATLVVGSIVGAMAQKMLDENIAQIAKKSEISEAKPKTADR